MCQISMGFRQRLFGKCPKVLPFGTNIHLLLVNERPMKSKCDLVSGNENCAQAFVGDVLQRLFISKIKLQSSIMSSNTVLLSQDMTLLQYFSTLVDIFSILFVKNYLNI